MAGVVPVSVPKLEEVAVARGIRLTTSKRKTHGGDADEAPRNLPDRVRQVLQVDERLAARWHGETEGLNDKSRSSVVMSLACILVRRYVPTAEIEAALRSWCAARKYDKGNRQEWIDGV